MKKNFYKFVATVLASLILVLPGTLSARERRGIDLVITLKDGRYAAGELIAVKPKSLLLLSPAGKDESIAVADIATIKIVRKSKAWKGFLIGFAPGAIGGAVWGVHRSMDYLAVPGGIMGGLIIGTVTGLVGLAAGAAAGLDSEFGLAGLSVPERGRILAKLDGQARKPGEFISMPERPAAGGRERKPAGPAYELKRFTLTWLPGLRVDRKGNSYDRGVVPVRFTESLPPGEAGPYPSNYYMAQNSRPSLSLWRATMAYHWSPRLAAEIEYNYAKHTTFHLGDMLFTSTLDGVEYDGVFWEYEYVTSNSLLVGLTYKLIAPAFLQPHEVEIAAAAGPAWIGTALSEWSWSKDRTTIDRRTKLTARARASYDYHFAPAVSMGAYAEYRWLQADVPSYAVTNLIIFQETGGTHELSLRRMTEVTYPARTISMGGFACGLRLSFSF